RFGFLRTDRRIAETEISEPHVGEPFGVAARARCQADNGVSTVKAYQLGKANARGLVGSRNTYGCNHFLRAQGGFEQALEKSVGIYFALSARACDVDLAAECQQASRQFGRRIRKSDGHAEGDAVASCRMTDMRHRKRDQGCMLCDHIRMLNLSVTRQRADLDVLALLGDAVEVLDAVDVDQQIRCRQPHIERGDQALSAGEQPRIVLVLGEERHRLLDRFRLGVCEWRRLHVSSPFFLIVTGNAGRSMRPDTARKWPSRYRSHGAAMFRTPQACGMPRARTAPRSRVLRAHDRAIAAHCGRRRDLHDGCARFEAPRSTLSLRPARRGRY